MIKYDRTTVPLWLVIVGFLAVLGAFVAIPLVCRTLDAFLWWLERTF